MDRDRRVTLVGRDVELEQLERLVDRVGTNGGALVVRGEAGIGKSALLHVAMERARTHGASVVTTTGTQAEARLAFGGLHQMLLPFLDTLDELPKPQRLALDVAFGVAEGDAPDLFLIGLATLGALTESASRTPVVLVVEDAHWLDRSTAEVLAFVGRRLEMEGVLLLLAVRDGEDSAFDDAGLPALHVSKLDDSASRALLAVNGAGLSHELQERILVEADGNPLALIELTIAATGLEAGSAREPLPLTARLEKTFAARLDGLNDDQQALLLLSAVDDGDIAELTRAAEVLLGRPVILASWTSAAASGLGIIEGARFRFRHPLMRSAVHRTATGDQRRRAHEALSETLAADPDRAVWHRAAAALGPDEHLAADLVAAADRATLRGGLDAASVALERAAVLTPDPHRSALRLLDAANLALEQGAADRCVMLLREALHLGLPPHQTVHASFTLETLSSAWSGATAIPRFAEIAQDLAADGNHHGAVEAIATFGMRAFLGPLDDSVRHQVTGIVADLEVSANAPRRLEALALIDPVHRGGEVVAQLRTMSPVGMFDARELLAVGEAASAVWADDLAAPFLRTAVDDFRATGRLIWLGQALALQAWVDARRGAVRSAITAAAEAERVAAETRQLRYVPVAQLAHAVAAADVGEEEAAEGLAADAEAALLPMGAHPLLALVALARGRIALAADRPAEAYVELLRIFTRADTAYQPYIRGWALADLTEATLRGNGDTDHVRDILREWAEISNETQAPHLRVQLAYADALLAQPGSAERTLRAAISAGAEGWPFYAARAQLALGEWLRRQHRDADARTPLRDAAQTFDGLGQRRYADRALRELRATGERARRRTPDAWTQLSPQELQIAQLAADGLSNREIGERLYLSHRTIGTHLYNLFPKLGITSRAQLSAALQPPAE